MKNRLQLKFIKKGMTSLITEDGKVESCTVLQLPDTKYIGEKKDTKHTMYFSQYNRRAIKKPQNYQLTKLGVNVEKKTKGFIFETLENGPKEITVDIFKDMNYISVQGTTKGKGFCGVMKRHNFKGGRASHGNSLAHRTPGSTGSNQDPGKVMKGKKMAGHKGNELRKQHNLKILDIDTELKLLVVKGSVPGPTNSIVTVEKGRKQ